MMPSSSLFGFPALFAARRSGWIARRWLRSGGSPGLRQAIQAYASGEGDSDSYRAQREAGFIAAVFFSRYSLAVASCPRPPGLFNHGGLILLFRHYGFQC
jgi:hypothetical protein